MAIVDPASTAPLLISTAPTRRTDRYVAIAIVIVSVIGFAASLPFIDRTLPHMVAFVQADDTGLILVDVLTAALLIGQFAQLRARSLLILASGYIMAGMMGIAHLLSSAEVLRAVWSGFANEEVETWLYLLWHGLFPVFVALYAVQSHPGRDRIMPSVRVLPMIAWCSLLGLLVTILCVASARIMPSTLPFAVAGNTFAAGFAWAVTAISLAVLFLSTFARRVLDLWLCVVLFALLLDITMGGLIGRSTHALGWYAGRIYGLLAASLILTAMLLETGTLYARLIATMREMREQAEALSKSEAALRQAQKMDAIGQLTGGVAHDFNNLLTVIIGSLDMLRHHVADDERATRLASYATDAAAKGEQLTKQLLAFSRRQMVNPDIRDPNRLIKDFEPLIRRALGEATEIVLDLEPSVGLVRVDPAQFESAILNLAVNARDAMDNMGTITIATRQATVDAREAAETPEANPGAYIIASVSDTGMGMDADTIARVFEPFFTTKPVGKGSGLGLSQVYGFVKSSGGFVTIDSKPDEGATIRLFLPRVEGIETVKAAGPAAPEPEYSATGELILVVEDDPNVREIVVETLEDFGYETVTAGNATEALDRLKKDCGIALMFSDIVMPGGMNGAQLATAARKLRPELKILLTTGYAAGALSVNHAAADDIGILAKPYLPDDLAQRVTQLLHASPA
jgi:signal transduction histidine kinase/ActR/RegA family two-component response regulator